MEGFCRACLVKFDDSSNLYPYSEKNRRLFVYSTGLQQIIIYFTVSSAQNASQKSQSRVKRNDNIIFQICKDCYSGMKYACTFKKNCRNSDRKLKSYFTLKEDGDSTDLSSYLKNNDETLKLRLPLNIGSSTPANHRREDDNDSTCTSIQNFMTDILPPVDIPDNEAKIIREVIEEEADILEDSLDSHWLHDDSSVDTDFRLDFSFSPFATPRLIKDDHCYSPIKKQDHPSVQPRYQTHKKVEKFLDTHYGIKDVSLQKLLDANFDSPLKEFDCPLKAFSVEQTCSIDLNLDNSLKKDQTCTVDLNLDNALKKDQICTIDNLDNALRKDQVCSIDLNLDNALKRDTECVSLDRILTPTVRDDISAPATPLITNILFGDKVEEELDEKENDKRMEDDIDVIEEFLNVNVKCEENIIETTDVKVNEEEGKKVKVGKTVEKVTKEELAQTNKFCITNFYCKMCNKKFRHLKGLKIHSNKYHKMKIDFTPKKKQARRKMVCDICGMIFQTPRCLISHLENHNKPTSFSCKYCPLQFSSQVRVNMHMTTHTGVVAESKKERKHVCTVCGKAFSSSSNYSTHMRRHKKAFTFACEECGKHFYRTTDLNTHMRRHTGARPYSCTSCHKSYSRSDALNRHMKMHSGILPFPCSFCDKKFPKASELRLHLKHNKACILLQASAAKT